MDKRKDTSTNENGKKCVPNISKRKKHLFLALRIALIIFLVGIITIAGILFGIIYEYHNSSRALSDKELILSNFSTIIYDKNGEKITELNGEVDRSWISFEKIPKHVQHAFVALQDENFYKHNGTDWQKLINTLFTKITTGKTQGAGTITMKLIRIITNDRVETLKRKIEEQYRATKLEEQWNKDKILEYYLNAIPLHGKVSGIQEGMLKYFGKDMNKGNEVTLAEAACISTITERPAFYNPTTNEGQSHILEKMKTVLKKMLEQGYINKSEYNKALDEGVKFTINEETKEKEAESGTSSQSYFIDALIRQLASDLGKKNNWTLSFAKTEIYSKGYSIYTTYDKNVQEAMDKVFKDPEYFDDVNDGVCKSRLENGIHYGKQYNLQAGMVIMDMDGYVRGIYGGRGEKEVDMAFNRATGAESAPGMRNPGSIITPILVYAPALDMGDVTSATVLDDSPMYLTDKGKLIERPLNFTQKHFGLINLRYAAYTSNNIFAAKTWLDLIDRDIAFEYIEKVGFTDNELMAAKEFSRTTSLPLGQAIATNPLRVAGAYMTFANKGVYKEPTLYTKLVDHNKKVVIDKTENKKDRITSQVYSDETSYLMHDMLTDVFKKGTASGLSIKNSKDQHFTTAGKTGITENNKDYWLVGYTPKYIGAIWFGDDNLKPLPEMKHGTRPDKKIWYDIMMDIHKDEKPIKFEKPSGITTKSVCKYSGLIPTPLCEKDKGGSSIINEIFSTKNLPKESCKVHVEVKICTEGSKNLPYLVKAGPNCPDSSVKTYILRDRTSVIQYVLERNKEDIKSIAMLKETAPWEICPIHSTNAKLSISQTFSQLFFTQ